MTVWQDDAARDLVLNAGDRPRDAGPRRGLVSVGCRRPTPPLDFARGYRGDLPRACAPGLRGGGLDAGSHARPCVELLRHSAPARTRRTAQASRGCRYRTGGCSSRTRGAEANEAAFKLARLHGGAERTRIPRRSRTASTDARWRSLALYREGVDAPRRSEPMPAGVEHIPATIEALEAAMDDRVAAIIVEAHPGVRPASSSCRRATSPPRAR